MSRAKHSRRRAVVEHILNYGGITRAYALAVFKIQNLPQVVMELRRKFGWPIEIEFLKREDGLAQAEWFISETNKRTLLLMGRYYYENGLCKVNLP